MRLAHLVNTAVPHETTPAAVDPRLRFGAFVGMGLLAAYAATLWLMWSAQDLNRHPIDAWFAGDWLTWAFTLGGHAQLAFRLVLATLMLSVALAVITRGFREARLPGLLAVYGIHLAGLAAAVPLVVAILVIGLMVVAVIVAVVVGAAVMLGLLFAFLSS